jgi:hypothetical protein
MAPRSRQVMLSCPSSLPGHSDFPTPITAILPVSPDLLAAYRRRSPAETLGSQVFPPLSVTACRWPYPGSPPGAYALCFPGSAGLLPKYRGSAYIPALQVYPSIGLPQLCPSDHILRGCTIRLTLRPAVLAGTPDWVKPAYPASRLGTVSGQVQPACYHTNPPPAYISIRAIDMITSSQVKR